MRKIFLLVLGSFFFTSWCCAQDHYALVEVLIKNDAGTAFIMNTITKVPGSEICAGVLSPINQLKDMYQVRTECVSGQKWDELFKDAFTDKPASTLYISYKDLDGYETRINTKVLASSHSSRSGLAADLPLKDTIIWANAIIKALKKGGIKNAKIIYPPKEKQ